MEEAPDNKHTAIIAMLTEILKDQEVDTPARVDAGMIVLSYLYRFRDRTKAPEKQDPLLSEVKDILYTIARDTTNPIEARLRAASVLL